MEWLFRLFWRSHPHSKIVRVWSSVGHPNNVRRDEFDRDLALLHQNGTPIIVSFILDGYSVKVFVVPAFVIHLQTFSHICRKFVQTFGGVKCSRKENNCSWLLPKETILKRENRRKCKSISDSYPISSISETSQLGSHSPLFRNTNRREYRNPTFRMTFEWTSTPSMCCSGTPPLCPHWLHRMTLSRLVPTSRTPDIESVPNNVRFIIRIHARVCLREYSTKKKFNRKFSHQIN